MISLFYLNIGNISEDITLPNFVYGEKQNAGLCVPQTMSIMTILVLRSLNAILLLLLYH